MKKVYPGNFELSLLQNYNKVFQTDRLKKGLPKKEIHQFEKRIIDVLFIDDLSS